MGKPRINIPEQELARLCRKWMVEECALFGSVLREDFGPESDVDVLVSFSPDAHWSLFDLVRMADELENIIGRKVDIVERSGLRNPFRRHAILTSREVIYAA